MKKIQSIICFFLVALLLAGCANPTPNNSAQTKEKKVEIEENKAKTQPTAADSMKKGGFVGTNITPEGVEQILIVDSLSDGTLLMYAQNLDKKYVSHDNGENWESTDTSGLPFDLDNYDKTGIHIAIAPNGSAYSCLQNYSSFDKKQDVFTIKKVAGDGTVSEISIKELNQWQKEGKGPQITYMGAINANTLHLKGVYWQSEGVQVDINSVYNTESGEKLYDISFDELYNGKWTFDEKSIYYLADDENGFVIKSYGIADGKVNQETSLKAYLNSNSKDVIAKGENSEFYSLGKRGIYKLSAETGEVTQLAKVSNLVLANPDYTPKDAVALSDTEFIVSFYTDNGHELWKFKYDENYVVEQDKNLTVWAVRENRALQQMASSYLKEHPDMNISIDYGFAYDEQMTAAQKDDYIKNINTQILSGADADILVLDSLPAKQYAKQGILADLSDKIDTSDFWANFAEQLKIDDKLFYAPVGFTLPIIQVRKEFFTKYPETFDEWISYIETTATYSEEEMLKAQIVDETEEYKEISGYKYPKEKQPFFPVRGFQDIYDLMWAGNEPALIENSKINEENMQKYLKALKLLADKADVFREDEEKKSQGFDPDVYEDLSMNFEGDGFSGSYNYNIYDGSAIASMSVESSTPDPLSLEEYQGKSAIMPMPSMNGGTWKPQNLLAINVQSNKQEAAADFIQSVYTPEWQNEWSEFFIPMTKSAYRLSVEKENEMNRERKEELENNPEQMEHWTEEDLKMLEPIEVEKTVQSFDTLLQKVKAPVVTDYVVRNAIWEPVLNYAKGDVSLEETMSQIHAKTKIYLAERVQ